MSIQRKLTTRGVDRVVHFHCDHFEPDAICKDLGERAPEVVMRLLSESRKLSGCTPSLFLKPPISMDFNPTWEEPVRFRENSVADIAKKIIRCCISEGYDLHVHVHHERWTRNTQTSGRLSQDEGLNAFLRSKENTHEMDSWRFARYIELQKDIMASCGWDPKDWCFVHGCWALNASDPEICQISDEIVRLHYMGGRGDFSFPSGRPRCDPKIKEPFSIALLDEKRSYDSEDAYPNKMAEWSLLPSRFLVWNSHRVCGWAGSLDYMSDTHRGNIENPHTLERFLIGDAPVINGTAYLKTFAHSLNPFYYNSHGCMPLAYASSPHVLANLNEEYLGVPVERMTVRQVIKELEK